MDSEWEFEHPGGSFAIEFRADAVNSCACTPSEHSPERQPRETSSFAHDTSCAFTAVVCAGFPAQAYWRMNDIESDTPTVYIDWGKYGEYELKMAPNGESMAGGLISIQRMFLMQTIRRIDHWHISLRSTASCCAPLP